jgi:hypothetical protein
LVQVVVGGRALFSPTPLIPQNYQRTNIKPHKIQ